MTALCRPVIYPLLFTLFISILACSAKTDDTLHGYIEGEFVYISAQLPGTVTLQVEKGQMVKQHDPLFALDSVAETASRDEAQRRVAQAKSILADLGKGGRPEELAALEARLREAREARALSDTEFGRLERLHRSGTVSTQDLDRARSASLQLGQKVAQLQAEADVARLGGRSDQLEAARANLKALEAALERAQWDLSRKSQRAPVAAQVFDTLYRSGEFVPAGKPVLSLLPDYGRKARFFVPEARIAQVRVNDPVTVRIDGVKEPLAARVSYISPKAEYTPPVIYSRESRSKLVFMVEAAFAPDIARRLNPGQPVDLKLGQ